MPFKIKITSRYNNSDHEFDFVLNLGKKMRCHPRSWQPKGGVKLGIKDNLQANYFLQPKIRDGRAAPAGAPSLVDGRAEDCRMTIDCRLPYIFPYAECRRP